MWMEEIAPKERVNVIRAKELAETGADTVTQLDVHFVQRWFQTDSLQLTQEMEVKDIAEIVWGQIKANDAIIQAKKAENEAAA